MSLVSQLSLRVAQLEKLLCICCPHANKAQRIALVEIIQNIVCDELCVSKTAMLGECRVAHLVWARHVAMSLATEFSGLSCNVLPPLFNRLDHATILHAIKRVSHAQKTERLKALQVSNIRARIVVAIDLCQTELPK